MEKEKKIQLSRRDFIKATVAGIGSIAVLGKNIDTVHSLSDYNSLETEKTSQKDYCWIKDSLGRSVKIPKEIKYVVPTGHMAQIIMMTLCPDKLVSIAEKPSEKEYDDYERSDLDIVYTLQDTGELYKNKDTRSIKTSKIAKVKADLILDIGNYKDDLAISLDYLQKETNIPTVFIDASFGNLPETYRKVGVILGCEERAEQLAKYIDTLYYKITNNKTKIKEPVKVFFAANERGIGEHHSNRVQERVIEFIGAIPVELNSTNADGNINTTELNDLILDYVIFNDFNSFEELVSRNGPTYDIWADIDAIKNNMFSLAPGLYHSWFGFDFFAQTIGVIWLSKTIYPRIYDESIVNSVVEYYKMFFNYRIDEVEVEKLLHII